MKLWESVLTDSWNDCKAGAVVFTPQIGAPIFWVYLLKSSYLNMLKKMMTKQTNSQTLQRRTKAAMKVSNQILLGWGGAVINDVCSGRDESDQSKE